MAWRSVESLKKLRKQIEEKYPEVDKTKFGTIGDTAHQATKSNHNPESDGTVDALDIPHQPEIGLDAHKIANTLLNSHDKRISYIISNRRIGGDENYAKRNSVQPWVWGPYNGDNPHDHHIHVSVNDATQDNASPWDIGDDNVTTGWKSGKGSWFSHYKGRYDWVDEGDKPDSNALGVSDWAQGIALYDQGTLGKWFEVQYPNGRVSVEQQTDIGPAPGTGRTIDISAVAAERAGYIPHYVKGANQFPTDALLYYREVPAPESVNSLSKKEQATAYYKLRQSVVPVPQPQPQEPEAPTSLEDAFREFREGQEAWNKWLEVHVKADMPEAPNEFAELFEEIKPVLLRNLFTLYPIINQFPVSAQAKLFRLGLSGIFSLSQAAPEEEPEETQPQPTRSTWMTNDQMMTLMRGIITTFGGVIAGFFAAKGWFTYDQVMGVLTSETFIGLAVSAASVFFGVKSKSIQGLLSSVSAMPEVKQVVVTSEELAKATPSTKVVDRPQI
jgi:hypothetical protein